MSFIRVVWLLSSFLVSSLSFGQSISVTVSEKVPVTIYSLDFQTALDEISIKALKQEGVQVDVYSTELSAEGARYACKLTSVTKDVYDKLADRWKVQLASAKITNTSLENQDRFLEEVYATLLGTAKMKAYPIAKAMKRQLGEIQSIELLEYYTIESQSAQNPFASEVFAKLGVDFVTKR